MNFALNLFRQNQWRVCKKKNTLSFFWYLFQKHSFCIIYFKLLIFTVFFRILSSAIKSSLFEIIHVLWIYCYEQQGLSQTFEWSLRWCVFSVLIDIFHQRYLCFSKKGWNSLVVLNFKGSYSCILYIYWLAISIFSMKMHNVCLEWM